MKRTWVVTIPAQPWSVNEQVRWHWTQRAEMVRAWRMLAAAGARTAQVPSLTAATITITTTVAKPRRLHDAGNEFYAAKAAVDGLVDAAVLPDDKPAHLRALTFTAPQRGPASQMALTITEEPAMPELYDHAQEPPPAHITLDGFTARALLQLLRAITPVDPHHQRIAADLHDELLRVGVR